MFVTVEDFNTPPYDLPNLEGNDTFLDFVDEQEELILVDLFGRFLYNAFIIGLGKPVADIEQRWIDLRDGKTYKHYNFTYHWYGMNKLLTPYIYCRWLEYNVDHATGVGVVVANTENSTVVSSAHKMVRGWNQFADFAGEIYCGENNLWGYLFNSGDAYTDVYPIGEYSNFMQYLYYNFNSPGYRNALGI